MIFVVFIILIKKISYKIKYHRIKTGTTQHVVCIYFLSDHTVKKLGWMPLNALTQKSVNLRTAKAPEAIVDGMLLSREKLSSHK